MTRSLVALALVLLAAPARADVITYHFRTDSLTQAGTAPQFDPALGTLTAADWSFDESGGGTAAVASNGPYAGLVTVALFNPMAAPGWGTTLSPAPATFVVPFGGTAPTFTFAAAAVYSRRLTAPSDLAGLTGHSAVSVQIGGGVVAYEVTSGDTFGPPRTVSFGAGGTGDVAYTYTAAVPEPPSLVLSMVAVACVAAGRFVSHRR